MTRKDTRFLFLAIVLLMNSFSYTCRAGLISLWEFNFESAMDSYGDNHGTLHGDPDFTIGRSGLGSALELNGRNYVSIKNEYVFDITDAITVAAWIKVNSFDIRWQSIITKGDCTWRLMRESNKNVLAFHLTGNTSDNKKCRIAGLGGKFDVADGKWHHVAGVYDGEKAYLYIDGMLDTSVNASGLIATNDFQVCIGENQEKNGRIFNGLIDNVAIFDHGLSEEEVKRLYRYGVSYFVSKGYMAIMTEEAEAAIQKLKPQESIAYLEKKIIEYNKWKIENIQHIKPQDERISSNIYVLLAKAKEAAGYPIEDIIEDYKKSVRRPQKPSHYMPATLSWLFDKIPTEEYNSIVKECVRNSHHACYDIHNIATHFESENNWAAFEIFFNSISREASDNISYAIAAADAFKENEAWVGKFREYYNLQQVKAAIRYTSQKNFKQATDVYQNIINQCGSRRMKNIYELKLYECLFNDNQFKTVVENIDSFINNNRATERIMTIKATLLKGQAYIQMGNLDQAIDAFLTLLIEYPQTKQAPGANFFIGYCYMLQGKFSQATEAFNLLVKEYPQSSYVAKAESYLSRIENITD